MDQDQIIDAIRATLDAYFDDIGDPADVDTDDLAENIATALHRAGALNT